MPTDSAINVWHGFSDPLIKVLVEKSLNEINCVDYAYGSVEVGVKLLGQVS